MIEQYLKVLMQQYVYTVSAYIYIHVYVQYILQYNITFPKMWMEIYMENLTHAVVGPFGQFFRGSDVTHRLTLSNDQKDSLTFHLCSSLSLCYVISS